MRLPGVTGPTSPHVAHLVQAGTRVRGPSPDEHGHHHHGWRAACWNAARCASSSTWKQSSWAALPRASASSICPWRLGIHAGGCGAPRPATARPFSAFSPKPSVRAADQAYRAADEAGTGTGPLLGGTVPAAGKEGTRSVIPHSEGEVAAASDLATLLRRCRYWPSAAAVAEARAIGPDRAGAVVRALLDADPLWPGADLPAVPAAILAGVLRLESAAASLVRCVERLPRDELLATAALGSIGRIGPAALEPALAAFDACPDPAGRSRLGDALVSTGVKDGRVLEALLRTFREEPEAAAVNLVAYGDGRAIPELSAALDRGAVLDASDLDFISGLCLIELAWAIEMLGGRLSPSQQRSLDRTADRLRALERTWWDPGGLAIDEHSLAWPPARRPPRRGRNERCHCGSGRKYKRCHLEADRRGERR